MKLDDIRTEIDAIDDELLKLFLKRMELAKAASQAKKKSGRPILDNNREREILKNIAQKSGDMSIYSQRMFKEVIELSRSYQEAELAIETEFSDSIKSSLIYGELLSNNATIACQGIKGAYSQQAAEKLFPNGNITFFESFEEVCEAVKKGICDYGVLPIENSSFGSVHAVYDILKNGGLSIIRSIKLQIDHKLLAMPGTTLSNVREVISHEQAIGQCGHFLKSLGNKVTVRRCANTAVAAKYASENEGVAAISSSICQDLYGLVPITEFSIQDSDRNFTRFICISSKPEIYTGANRISFFASSKHEPGALYRLISIIGSMNVNILKIESRPIPGRDFEFLFIFDIEASVCEPGIISMLEELRRISESFVFLGNYQEEVSVE